MSHQIYFPPQSFQSHHPAGLPGGVAREWGEEVVEQEARPRWRRGFLSSLSRGAGGRQLAGANPVTVLAKVRWAQMARRH